MAAPTTPGTYRYTPAVEEELMPIVLELVLFEGVLVVKVPDGAGGFDLVRVPELPGDWERVQ